MVLNQWKCSIQSCSFVQCWHGIFLVQCQGNLCNVDVTFAANCYCQKINWFKIKIDEKWCYSDETALVFFLCNVVWSLLGNSAQGFCLSNVVPRVLLNFWTDFFHVQCCLEPLREHCTRNVENCARLLSVQICPKKITGFYLCNVVPRVLRQHWTGFFLVHFSLEPQGQHCLGYLLVQCCPKNIKTTLNRIFSCAMLSGASRTTLNRIFFLCNAVWNLLGNIAQGFYLCNVGSWLTDNSS